MAPGPELTPPDWKRPWYAPFRQEGEGDWANVTAGRAVADAFTAPDAAQPPVRFVPASELPAGEAYEAFIRRTGSCPTRNNMHDFFNALCWRTFPHVKRQLNRVQAAEIARSGIGAVRGPVRDAVTLLDENGALLDAPAPLSEALVARDWRRAFVALRPLWAHARLVVLGHALLEQLLRPRKNLTAHVWIEPVGLQDLAAADVQLAARLTADRLASKPFTPLPVLGIPGWCADNENFSFYDDSLVFRPRRP